MYQIYTLLIFYIIIVLCQIIYLKYFTTLRSPELEAKINYNNQNMQSLEQQIDKILIERVNMLKNKQISYDNWIQYNADNDSFIRDNKKYYIFLFESLDHTNFERFIAKVHVNPNYVNLSWDDIRKDVFERLVSFNHSIDDNLLSNMYNLSNTNTCSTIEYFWLDPLSVRPVKKLSRVIRFFDTVTGKTGIMGMGIDVSDLTIDNSYIYYQKINIIYPLLISVLSAVVSVLLINIKHDSIINYKSMLLMVVINLYIARFLGNIEFYGNTTSEQLKETNINSGILSVTFLFAVNIFILTTLQKTHKNTLFIECGLVFTFAVVLLLLSMVKKTNNITTTDITSSRLSTQLLFNTSIILNMLIMLNYVSYVLSIRFDRN